MATYLALCQWTQKGIEAVKESPSRLDRFKEAVRSAGGSVKGFYMTMGRYDFAVVLEVPDDATAAKIALATARLGNARTETLRAFTEDEYRKILGELS